MHRPHHEEIRPYVPCWYRRRFTRSSRKDYGPYHAQCSKAGLARAIVKLTRSDELRKSLGEGGKVHSLAECPRKNRSQSLSIKC
jgi:hypothetical protein